MTTIDTPTILAYCAVCNDDTQYTPETRTETLTVRGCDVTADVEVLVCPGCGHVRDAPEHDSMLAFYNAYRQKHSMLMPEEIVALRERYGLSREAFAGLLGMSPASLYRYEGGALQDKVHDIVLQSCQSPAQLVELVRRNPEALSALQLQRFQAALDRNHNMLTVLICRTLQLAGPTYKTKLNKLLFYADFIAQDLLGKTISGARYRAIQFGPVPTNYEDQLTEMLMYDLVDQEEIYLRQNPCCRVVLKQMPGSVTLSPRQDAIVQHVVAHFRGWGAKQVSDYSHLEDAWTQTPQKQIIDPRHARTLRIPRPTLPPA